MIDLFRWLSGRTVTIKWDGISELKHIAFNDIPNDVLIALRESSHKDGFHVYIEGGSI